MSLLRYVEDCCLLGNAVDGVHIFKSLVKFESSRIKLIIHPLLLQEAFVRAAFDNFAVIQDHDNVGVHDGGKAVGDDENGSAFHQPIHTFLDERFGSRVD